MIRRLALMGFALALAIGFVVVGCSDDSTGPGDTGPPPADFSGNWDLSANVAARRVCDNQVGDTRSWNAAITQDGASASLTIDGGHPIPLTVEGSSATGTSVYMMEHIEVALTIADGEISGSITEIDSMVPCTEVWSVEGVRTNAAPSSAFAGNWDFEFTVIATSCPAVVTEEDCLSIEVDGSTVSIDDGDEVIAGVGDGDTAILTRSDEDGILEVTLTVSGDQISGEAIFYDSQAGCQVNRSVTGTRRSSPCPPPIDPGEYAGNWDMLITVDESNCFDETPGESFPTCMLATVDGTDITLDDGSSEGPITGIIDQEGAHLSRSGDSGVLTVDLEIDGDQVFGTATMNYSSGDCASTQVVYSVVGSRRASPCESGGGGNFAGYWLVDGDFIVNECGFTLEPTCNELTQSGNTVYFVDDDITGTVVGNTLTANDEEVFATITATMEVVLHLSNDGNSFTGTETVWWTDSANPAEDCYASSTLTGVRVAGCEKALHRGFFGSLEMVAER